MTEATLFIVATPIGNLLDISARAIETLKNVDLLLCEDTRVTRNLLSHFHIQTPTKSFHEHSTEKSYHEVLNVLQSGQNIALVTDAGTPGISDPGNMLVEFIRLHSRTIRVVPVPGPSAVTAALSVSGFPTDKFLFLGFPPHKNKRQKFFEDIASCKYTVVFYESPYRIVKALASLRDVLNENRQVCVCRELTKKFESIYSGTIQDIQNANIPQKGEFVVMVRAGNVIFSS